MEYKTPIKTRILNKKSYDKLHRIKFNVNLGNQHFDSVVNIKKYISKWFLETPPSQTWLIGENFNLIKDLVDINSPLRFQLQKIRIINPPLSCRKKFEAWGTNPEDIHYFKPDDLFVGLKKKIKSLIF